MTKKKFYWKVVRKLDDDRYISVSTIGKFKITYKLNKKSSPNIGKIFIFKNREHARKFRSELLKWGGSDRRSFYKILKVKSGNTCYRVPEHIISDSYSHDAITKFWSYYNLGITPDRTTWDWPTPEGTMLSDYITPIEEIR